MADESRADTPSAAAPPTVTDRAPGTVVDAVAAPGTVVDGAPGTTLDGAPGTVVDGGSATFSRVNLLPSLNEQFVLEEEIGSGAEAVVLRCRDRASGERRVIKQYHSRSTALDEEMMRLVEGADTNHVARSYGWGQELGYWFEIQEYVPLGSLDDLAQAEGPGFDEAWLSGVLRELVTALDHVHHLGIVHRDLKPQNVLVRRRDPLDLVLADFGLATVLSRDRTMRSASRTPAYAAPEAGWGDVSRSRDWWALGVIMLELLTGEHPFRRPSGQWMEDAEIGAHLSTRPIDVSGITDRRWRLLCSGLLVRDPADRWGVAEVQRWREGEDPEVVETTGLATVAGIAPFAFEGQLAHTPVELARLFAGRWSAARRIVAGAKVDDPASVRLRTWLADHGDERAVRILGELGEPDRRLARLLVALDPTLPPRFDGHDLTTEGLVDLAEHCSSGGDGDPATVLRHIFEFDILGVYSALEGQAELARIDATWKHAMSIYDRAVGELPESARRDVVHLRRRALGFTLLACLASDDAITRLASRAVTRDSRATPWFAAHLQWTEAQTKDDRLGGHVLTVVLADLAEQAAAEEEERRQQVDDQAREQQRQQRQEQRTAARERRNAQGRAFERGDRRIVRWVIGLTLTGVVPIAIGFGLTRREIDPENGPFDDLSYLVQADPKNVGLSLFLRGLWVVPALGAGVLVLRRHWLVRRWGLTAAAIVGGLAAIAFFWGTDASGEALERARVEMFTSTIPKRAVTAGFCEQPRYWTGQTEPTRTFVDATCQTVRRFDAWSEVWTYTTPTPISELHASDGRFVAVSNNNTHVTVLDGATGAVLVERDCPNGVYVDTTILDPGTDTPETEQVAADCDGQRILLEPGT